MKQTVELPRGTLTIDYHATSNALATANRRLNDWTLDDLLGFAERINPKRAFLFVSKVLGRHIPVAPSTMRRAFSDLASLIPNDLPEPIIVMGMAETAVGLSAGVHQVLQNRFPKAILLNSTRHVQAGEVFATFSEDHSHASTHLIYQSDDSDLHQQVLNTKTLIMVDDEASTGNTCKNVVNALRQAGLQHLEQVHLATLVDWSQGKIQPKPFDEIRFFRHHLLSGSWQWQDRPNAPTVTMPKVDSIEAGTQPILATGNWGRKPTLQSDTGLPLLWDNLTQQIDLSDFYSKKVLVLGSNEFVWLPFLLAETLEKNGVMVKFSALTRSPIATNPASAVQSMLSFTDNYGLGMTNFVYNVVPNEWDWIILCVETPADSVDNIWLAMENVIIVNPC